MKNAGKQIMESGSKGSLGSGKSSGGGASPGRPGVGSPGKGPGGGPAMKPKALMCYICGREYGTSSLEIHLKSCKKKWEIEQEKLPKA